MHPYFMGTTAPRVFAHRGLVTESLAEQGVAENSFAALSAAAALNSAYIESDCHLTRDNQVVLFHDADLQRVANDPRRIADIRLPELERLMHHRGGLVTLAEALETFPSSRFNIDVKAAAAAEQAGRIIAPHAARVLVTSFSDANRRRALDSAARANPSLVPATSPGQGTIVRVLAAVASRSGPLIRRSLAGLDALQIPERHGRVRVLTPRLIAAAHRFGVEVHVWTVNDSVRMRELVALGVDGIVSDRADVAIQALGR